VWLAIPTWQYIVIFLFAFLYGGLKSGFGIAGALVTPALSLIIEPRLAVGLMGPLALCTDLAALRNHWGKWDKGYVRALLPVHVAGALIGAAVLRGISASLLNRMLAVITLAYAAVQLWPKIRQAQSRGRESVGAKEAAGGWMAAPAFGQVTSLAGGVIGAFSHAGGIVMTFYLLAAGLRKETYIATLVTLFFAQNVIKLPLYLGTGVLTLPALWLTVLAIPLVFAGGAVGKWAGARLSARQFDSALNGIMIAMGLMLLFK
jgi:uncharacterized membrane protein YfcA